MYNFRWDSQWPRLAPQHRSDVADSPAISASICVRLYPTSLQFYRFSFTAELVGAALLPKRFTARVAFRLPCSFLPLCMSSGSLLCVLVLLQALYPCLLAGKQLIAGQIVDDFLCQDPIRRPSLMLRHAPDEFNGTGADPISDEELVDGQVLVGDDYTEDHGGVPDKVVAGGEADVDDGEELLLGVHGDDGEAKDNSGERASGEVQCPECGKRFKNDKSMFGHLRSHPNRGYKGANPPVKKLKSLPNSNDASPASLSPVDDRPMARHSQRDPRLSPYEILAAYVMLTIRYRNNQATQQAPLPSPSCRKRKHESTEQAEGFNFS